MIYLDRKEVLPIFQELSNKKTFIIEVVEQVRLSSNYWSGGTRYEYTGVDLVNNKIIPPDFDEYGNPFTHPNVPTVKLEPNMAIVKTGVFCGKHIKPVIYLHPENANKLIKQQDSGLTDNEKIVLRYTKMYKNTYGGETNLRWKEANREKGISQEDWLAAQKILKEKKMLDKRGAITNAGRNSI